MQTVLSCFGCFRANLDSVFVQSLRSRGAQTFFDLTRKIVSRRRQVRCDLPAKPGLGELILILD
jgi:hypothetical protein